MIKYRYSRLKDFGQAKMTRCVELMYGRGNDCILLGIFFRNAV